MHVRDVRLGIEVSAHDDFQLSILIIIILLELPESYRTIMVPCILIVSYEF